MLHDFNEYSVICSCLIDQPTDISPLTLMNLIKALILQKFSEQCKKNYPSNKFTFIISVASQESNKLMKFRGISNCNLIARLKVVTVRKCYASHPRNRSAEKMLFLSTRILTFSFSFFLSLPVSHSHRLSGTVESLYLFILCFKKVLQIAPIRTQLERTLCDHKHAFPVSSLK